MKTYVLLVTVLLLLSAAATPGFAAAPPSNSADSFADLGPKPEAALTITPNQDSNPTADDLGFVPDRPAAPRRSDDSEWGPALKPPRQTYTPVEDPGFMTMPNVFGLIVGVLVIIGFFEALGAERARTMRERRSKWSRIRLVGVVTVGLGLALYVDVEVVRVLMVMGKIIGVVLLSVLLLVGLMYAAHVLWRRLSGNTCDHHPSKYWPWSAIFTEKNQQEAEVAGPGVRSGGSMKTPLKALAAAALILVVLFLAPVAYQTGKRVGLWLNCPSSYGDDCWVYAGYAVMHGGKLPR